MVVCSDQNKDVIIRSTSVARGEAEGDILQEGFMIRRVDRVKDEHSRNSKNQNQNQKIFNEKLANRNYNIKHRR